MRLTIVTYTPSPLELEFELVECCLGGDGDGVIDEDQEYNAIGSITTDVHAVVFFRAMEADGGDPLVKVVVPGAC